LTYRPVKPAIVIWAILDILAVMGKILYMKGDVVRYLSVFDLMLGKLFLHSGKMGETSRHFIPELHAQIMFIFLQERGGGFFAMNLRAVQRD